MVVGYKLYLGWIEDLCQDKEIFSSGMRQEVERVKVALGAAQSGKVVALISSGDAGIYGMAGLALELASQQKYGVEIEVIPGITASSLAASRLGAPLMQDFATISLSDLLVDWQIIRKRLQAVAEADLVTVLYNPRSRKRVKQLEETVEIFLQYQAAETPCGIATAVGSEEESSKITFLGKLLEQEIGMRSTVIIGNSTTRITENWLITPRGYHL